MTYNQIQDELRTGLTLPQVAEKNELPVEFLEEVIARRNNARGRLNHALAMVRRGVDETDYQGHEELSDFWNKNNPWQFN